MKIRIKLICVILIAFFSLKQGYGQFEFKISDVSVAVTDFQYGLPFIKTFPIHPGIEVGATILKKEKEKSSHSFGANLGFFHHNVLANAPYLITGYNYQRNIKQTIGLQAGAGLGYMHTFYPGESYEYNKNTNEFEPATNSSPFFLIDAGLGISYLKMNKVQPFIRYNVTSLNIYNYFTSTIKFGITLDI